MNGQRLTVTMFAYIRSISLVAQGRSMTNAELYKAKVIARHLCA
jgi:hypothetical protein